MQFTPQEPPTDPEEITPTAPLDEKQRQALAQAAFRRMLAEATPRLIVTPAIVALNVLVFVLMAVSGVSLIAPSAEQILDWGASFGPRIFDGEWWRLLSAMFVHIGALHLAFNMQALWNLGRIVERLYGNWTTLLIYLLSGVGGTVASLWVHSDVVAAGASGAIFGVAGALAVAIYRGKLPLPSKVMQSMQTSTLLFIGYNLLFGFTSRGIDNAAHIGGLVVGAAGGWLLLRGLPRAEADPQSHRTRSLALSAGMLALALVTLIAKSQDPLTDILKAEELLSAGEFDQALAEIDGVLERQPDNAVAHFVRGNVFLQKGDYEEALFSYAGALSLDPQMAEVHHNRGLVYIQMMRLEDALADFDRAIELAPDDAEAHFMRGLVYADLNRPEAAIADMEKALSLGLDEEMSDYAETVLGELKP